uniref:Phosphate-regulating neutral endopeptidase (inferred by orthology to a human protein) n=1 Tax=Strongyloides venezuelensis TaxID=75913 RepID=A0A0K0EU61_STRVS
MKSYCLFLYATLIIIILSSNVWISVDGKKIRTNVTRTSNSLLKYISFLIDPCDDFYYFSCVMINNIRNYESLLRKNDTKLRKTCVNYIVKIMTDGVDIMILMDNNAFYNPDLNNIVINPSILVDPCFDIRFPMSLNYGCVGVIMGHEIVHGFDAIGKQYTNETLKQFGNDYRKFRVLDKNIADNGGIKIAYRAYLKYLKKIGGKESIIPRLEKFTGKQLFFVNWARFFCSLNNHPINMNNATHRVRNTLSNYKSFLKAFISKFGTKINPRHSCEVWL